MTIAHEHLNPLSVLDAVIADLRASGDTGHVENLLQARSAIVDLVKTVKSVAEYRPTPGLEAACITDNSRLLIDALSRSGVQP